MFDFEHIIKELSPVDQAIFLLYFMDNKSKKEVAADINRNSLCVWRHLRRIEQFVFNRMQQRDMFPLTEYFKSSRSMYRVEI